MHFITMHVFMQTLEGMEFALDWQKMDEPGGGVVIQLLIETKYF